MSAIRTPLLSVSSVHSHRSREEKSSIFKTLKIALFHGAKRTLSFFSCGCYRYMPAKPCRAGADGLGRSLSVAARGNDATGRFGGAAACIAEVQATIDFKKPFISVIATLEKKTISILSNTLTAPEMGKDWGEEFVVLEMDAVKCHALRNEHIQKTEMFFADLKQDCLSNPADYMGGPFEQYFQAYSSLQAKIETQDYEDRCTKDGYRPESDSESIARLAFESSLDEAFVATLKDLLLEAVMPVSPECNDVKLENIYAKSVEIFFEKRQAALSNLLGRIPTMEHGDMYDFAFAQEQKHFQGNLARLSDSRPRNLFDVGHAQEKKNAQLMALPEAMGMDPAQSRELLDAFSAKRIFVATVEEMIVMLTAKEAPSPVYAPEIDEITRPFPLSAGW